MVLLRPTTYIAAALAWRVSWIYALGVVEGRELAFVAVSAMIVGAEGVAVFVPRLYSLVGARFVALPVVARWGMREGECGVHVEKYESLLSGTQASVKKGNL